MCHLLFCLLSFSMFPRVTHGEFFSASFLFIVVQYSLYGYITLHLSSHRFKHIWVVSTLEKYLFKSSANL